MGTSLDPDMETCKVQVHCTALHADRLYRTAIHTLRWTAGISVLHSQAVSLAHMLQVAAFTQTNGLDNEVTGMSLG